MSNSAIMPFTGTDAVIQEHRGGNIDDTEQKVGIKWM